MCPMYALVFWSETRLAAIDYVDMGKWTGNNNICDDDEANETL